MQLTWTDQLNNSTDRMAIMLFAASLLHFALIFGIGFSRGSYDTVQQSLEITLAQYSTEEAPEKADFLAQANQEGSGTLEEKAILSTTEVADFADNVIREVVPFESAPPQDINPDHFEIITSTQPSVDRLKEKKEAENSNSEQKDLKLEALQRSIEIASLEAQLREKRQTHANRPKKRQLTAVSTKAARDAEYLDAWRTKIESIGNINYPTLNIKNLFGQLRLMVAVNANGTINNIRILQSSGFKRLDDAAIRVVRMAAPFAPFPEEIRKDTDILEIIRTWRFEKGHYLSSS